MKGTDMEQTIVYFDKPGPENTAAVIQAVRKRAEKLGVKDFAVASCTGKTAQKMWEAVADLKPNVVAVTEHAGMSGGDEVFLKDPARRVLEMKGIKVCMCSHALSGVARSISKKFNTISHVEIIAQTLKQFGGEGLKVAVEVAVMAADAGLVPTSREIIAVGGTGTGADTAIVLKAAHMNNFFDLEVREIICKPRQRE